MKAPIASFVVARHRGPRRIEQGPHRLGAAPCFPFGNGEVAEIALLPEVPNPRCLMIAPGERIVVVNRTGAFGNWGKTAVKVALGGYEARLAPQQAAFFPAPVGSYLGPGLHGLRVTGAPGPAVLVVRPSCIHRKPPPGLERRIGRCFQ